MEVVDQDEIHQSMVDLPDRQGPVGIGVRATDGLEHGACRLMAFATAELRMVRQLQNAVADRVGMWRQQARVATAPLNLKGGASHRRLLAAQIRLLDRR